MPGEDFVGLYQKPLVILADERIILQTTNKFNEVLRRLGAPSDIPQNTCNHTAVRKDKVLYRPEKIKCTKRSYRMKKLSWISVLYVDVVPGERVAGGSLADLIAGTASLAKTDCTGLDEGILLPVVLSARKAQKGQ